MVETKEYLLKNFTEKEWAKEEVDDYIRNYKQDRLGPAYLNAGLSSNEPHKRAKYLIKKLGSLGKETFFRRIDEYEKPLTLKTLEELIIRKFF